MHFLGVDGKTGTSAGTLMVNQTHRRPNKIEDAYPLSPLQQAMLFHTLLSQRTGVYIEQLVCDLREPVDEFALRQAWQIVIDQHPILRTKFRWEDLDEPRQEVQAQVEVPWEDHDWRGTTDAEQDRRIADLLEKDRRRGFDVAQAPLLRLTLVRCADAKNQLIWTFHHALLDGRSFTHILRQVFAYYDALQSSTELHQELPRPYKDYITWLQKRDFSNSEGFWTRALEGFTEPTPVVVDRAPTQGQEIDIGRDPELWLSIQVTSALRSLADQNQLTLNTIVQGAWSVLLNRYSHKSDVLFGVTRNCRRSTIDGAEAMIGLFINTLPLRVRFPPGTELIPWLKALRAQSLAMREHEHTPLEKVRGWSEVRAGRPLFESILVFETLDLNSLLRMKDGSLSNRYCHLFEQSNHCITLVAYAGTQLHLTIGFDRSRLDTATAARILTHLETLLEAMAERPDQLLRDLPLLTLSESQQLLVEWNRTEAQYPIDLCAHELFEEQVKRTPNAVAVQFEDQKLTYLELNNRSNQLAHYIRQLGVGPEVLVGLCVHRSLELIIGLFGILKAGGAYVPIDPAYPAERIEYMLKETDALIVLTQRKLIPMLYPLTTEKFICMDDPQATAENIGNLPSTAREYNLAYVNYTSGSTGTPKGVMIHHRAIMNVLFWMQSMFPLSERDCVLQHISISFDPAVLEILPPLLVGGRLVLAQPGGQQDPFYLARTILQRNVTIMHLVPSTLRMLLQVPEFSNCQSLRHVFCGGDILSPVLARRFFEIQSAEFHHCYGPTEVAITSLFHSVKRSHFGEVIPIGRPVANTRAYVLDEYQRLMPIGVSGELYLGGVQVGRGYYNRPELTAERFIPDPFSEVPGARLYRTGDLVRYLPDGDIQFLGRKDHQVKIRGHRIELGEIEAALRLHPAVQETVVVVQEDASGDKRLVGYVRPSYSFPGLERELRSILKSHLPTYMQPAAFVFLNAFPMTPTGKVDRGALPPPDPSSSEADESELYVSPRSSTEEVLVRIWREFLRVKQVSVRDNFFDLGGDSLMMVRMMSRVNQALNVGLGVSDFVQNLTIEKLAAVIKVQKPMNSRRTKVVPLQKGKGERPIYFMYAGPNEFRLAKLLGDSHQIFGIEVPIPSSWRDAVLANSTSGFPTMEALAAPYVAALRSHAQSSSCVLAGHSFAGIIAFEAAHQFQRQGGRVDMVMLLDTWATCPPWNEVPPRLRQLWKEAQLSHPIVFLWRWASLIARSMRRQPTALTSMLDEEGVPVPWWLLERLYSKSLQSYHPRPLDTRGILFRSEGKEDNYNSDESRGWRNLFIQGLGVKVVLGDHLSMLREHGEALSREINQVLAGKEASVAANLKAERLRNVRHLQADE
jgi:amino acid adenylation domain-containing protein